MSDQSPKSHFEEIRDFHTKFELSYEDGPRDLPDDMKLFRIGFMIEELAEYANASGFLRIGKSLEDIHEHIVEKSHWMLKKHDESVNLEVQFDSLIDLEYVLLGTSYLHGFRHNEGWNRVHAANMQKVLVENIEDSKRKSKYDIVKPRGWKAPVLKDLL